MPHFAARDKQKQDKVISTSSKVEKNSKIFYIFRYFHYFYNSVEYGKICNFMK